MHHLRTFEDLDTSTLLKDLKTVGFEGLESVFIQTISAGEGSFDCWILVAKNEAQMVEMLLDHDMISPITFGRRISSDIQKKQSVVALLQELYQTPDSDLIHFRVFKGVELQPSVKEPMLVCFQGFDFYKSINLLETYYTNIREVLEEDLKKDWGNNLYVQKWGK